MKHNTYGIMGDARGYGNDTLNAYFPGADHRAKHVRRRLFLALSLR